MTRPHCPEETSEQAAEVVLAPAAEALGFAQEDALEHLPEDD